MVGRCGVSLQIENSSAPLEHEPVAMLRAADAVEQPFQPVLHQNTLERFPTLVGKVQQPLSHRGRIDYQTNSAVDRWVKEKVLLRPSETHCAMPRGQSRWLKSGFALLARDMWGQSP